MRVYALAKELGVASVDVLPVLGNEDLVAQSSLSDEQVALVRDHFSGLGTASEAEGKRAEVNQDVADLEGEGDEALGYYGEGGTLSVGGTVYRKGNRVPAAVYAKLPVHIQRKLTLQSVG